MYFGMRVVVRVMQVFALCELESKLLKGGYVGDFRGYEGGY